MTVDRAALRAFFTGSPTQGYPKSLYGQVEAWRQALLAEARERRVAVHLTGTTNAPTHLPVDSALSDVAAQCSERWPDSTRADGRSWSLPDSLEQIALACRALDDADKAGAGGEAAPTPASTGTRPFVPPGVKATWTAKLDGATSRVAAGYNDDDWEYEPKDAKGTRCPVPIADSTGAGRGTVLSAYVPSGMSAKGRSEAHPKAPNAKAGVVAAFGYDVFIRSISSGSGAWGGDVLTQYAQGGYTPALELKLGGGKLFLDGNSGSWHHELGALPTGRWVSVAVRVVMATNTADARIDAWLDRRQVLTNVRPKGAGTLYGGGHNPYPKHGLYAAPGRGGEVLFDNVWFGTST